MDAENLIKGKHESTSKGNKKGIGSESKNPYPAQSPSIRRDFQNFKRAVQKKLKIIKYAVLIITLFQVANAQILGTNDLFNSFKNKQIPSVLAPKPEQHILFEEVGKLATQMKYIHVVIPLNISSFYFQAEVMSKSFQNLSSHTTSAKHRIPFTKAVRDTGVYGMKKLAKIVEKSKKSG